MVVLDTAIANVSLRYIAGSLAVSVDESTWIVTTYLIANAVILPISGSAIECDRPQALLHDLRRGVHGRFAVMRACLKPSPR